MPESSSASAAPLARRRAARRRLVFVVMAFVLVGVALEAGGVIAWWLLTGECFTWTRAAQARAQVHAGPGASSVTASRDDAVQWAAAHGVMVHPYLGYVHDGSGGPSATLPISSFGFYGAESPVRKRSADRYVIGVVGGSVAMQFGLYGGDLLAEALRRSPSLAQREIEIVNLALGGYKQPQQLLAVQLMLALGGEFDCVVCLDGFNEVALVNENVPVGVPAWFPRSWNRLLDSVPTPEQQRRLGHIAVLTEERAQRVATADSIWWSPLWQFLWRWRDGKLVARLAALRAEAERAAAAPSPAVTGPGTGGISLPEARTQMVALWRRASRQLHELCTSHDTLYLHCLQPNQYVPGSKPIGELEAKAAIRPDHPWREAVLQAYPELQRAGAELVAAGVDYIDLTRVFADHPEPLYTDTCCHFSRQGHAIVAEHIAAAIRQKLDLAEVELRSLSITPARIELFSPLGEQRLTVVGIDADGRQHDLSGSGFGTEVVADPPGQVAVSANGLVRAVRRGEAVLTVRQGDAVAEVRVTASWPDLFEADDAVPSAAGMVPGIALDPDAVAAGDAAVDVVCSSLPDAPFRFVAVAPYPLPATPLGAGAFGLTLVPIDADADAATVRIAIAAPPGQPMFVRFYALTADAAAAVAASRTIVVTRG